MIGLSGTKTGTSNSPKVPTVACPIRLFNKRGSLLCGLHRKFHRLPEKSVVSQSSGFLVCGAHVKPAQAPSQQIGNSFTKYRPPIYKVLLHDDNYNTKKYVVAVLLRVFKSFSKEDAFRAMNEAHELGMSLLIACPQAEAENFCDDLRLNGLITTLEPGC